jgi:hypothetical protein
MGIASLPLEITWVSLIYLYNWQLRIQERLIDGIPVDLLNEYVCLKRRTTVNANHPRVQERNAAHQKKNNDWFTEINNKWWWWDGFDVDDDDLETIIAVQYSSSFKLDFKSFWMVRGCRWRDRSCNWKI